MRPWGFAPFVAALLCFGAASAWAKDLPARLAVAAPFPPVIAQATTISFVAPGVQQADYEFLTADGPIAVHVVAVDGRRKDLHLGAVLARDRLISSGETVASMAQRTGAVAGINGDYFDINNTNAPLNILISDGRLLHAPRQRYAIAIDRDGAAHFEEFSFSATLEIGANSVALDGLDELPPPHDGTSLITPEFGSVPASQNLTLIALQLLDGTPPLARYRVTGIVDNTTVQPPGYYAAIGLNAYAAAGVPNVGDLAAVTGDLAPESLSNVAAAIGGGPLILHQGALYADPDGPSGGEFARLIPASGVALEPDGTLLLIEVDGRQPTVSIGVTRPQFAALMYALGATEGMALDGGGSSTLVARDLGWRDATVKNSPSDGRERPVGDGLFVYSDAPFGPAARVAIQPAGLRAIAGATIEVHAGVTDAAGHPVTPPSPLRMRVEPTDLGDLTGATFVAKRPGYGTLRVSAGSLTTSIPIAVVDWPARLQIAPDRPNLSAGERVRFTVRAYDAAGFAIALPKALPWSASSGRIDDDGTYVAGAAPATILVRVGAATARQEVTVGQREEAFSIGSHLHFATAPRGGPGNAAAGVPCPTCIQLAYDFSGDERAAYADVDAALPDGTIGVAFDVDGDGSGAILRIALHNAINETVLLTAARLDFNGRRHVVVRFPADLANGARLASVYVVDGIGGVAVRTAGKIVLRDVRLLLPGTGSRDTGP
jgi:hypothetical protein